MEGAVVLAYTRYFLQYAAMTRTTSDPPLEPGCDSGHRVDGVRLRTCGDRTGVDLPVVCEPAGHRNDAGAVLHRARYVRRGRLCIGLHRRRRVPDGREDLPGSRGDQ